MTPREKEMLSLLEAFSAFMEDQLDRIDAVISEWEFAPLAAGHAMERIRDIVHEEIKPGDDKPDSLPSRDREICICAAVRLPDLRVFRGHHHDGALRAAHQALGSPRGSFQNEQGFVTSRNRYVSREEGLQLQLAAGIKSACPSGYRVRELFSEDLY